MNFKRYKFLRGVALEKLQKNASKYDKQHLEEDKKNSSSELEDSLLLAYIGDGVYSVYVRDRVAETEISKVQVLHNLVTDFICAKAQAKSFTHIESLLTNEELLVAKRARNSHVNPPKNVELYEYRLSTAFEAVLGYLYRHKDQTRLDFIMNEAFSVVLNQLK